MPAGKLPGFIKKKRLLDNPDLPAAECQKYGQLFLAAGWLADALEFFLKGNDTQGLNQLEEIALETGDAFLLERLLQAQDREAPGLWERVAARAVSLEKPTLARWAAERAGLETGAGEPDPDLVEASLRGKNDGHAPAA